MKHYRTAAGLAFLTFAGLLVHGCGSDGASPEIPGDQQHQPHGVGPEDQERIEKGLELSPVALNLSGLDRNLVGLGSYIVNAQGACNDCHTNPPFVPGGDPFQGQPEQINTANFLAGGRQFGPGVVSDDLTPDEEGLPGGLTYEEFLARMRTGREADGDILQVMPWNIYAKMRDQDLRAIYEYLRAIPPAEPGTTPPQAP